MPFDGTIPHLRNPTILSDLQNSAVREGKGWNGAVAPMKESIIE
jgi:hypothetical protein